MIRLSRIVIYLITFLCIPVAQLEARLIISEFLAVNDKGIDDRDGDRSDWIEIRNTGDDKVNLDGWSLTDDVNNLAGWKFPSVTIDAGGYMLIFASGKNRSNPSEELHTNFKLNANGEYLGLIKPDGQTVAHHFLMKYPKQQDDVSYGLPVSLVSIKSSESTVIGGAIRFLDPTPGAPNNSNLVGVVEKLSFSRSHGFYEESFDLTVSTKTSDAVLRYTTDGSIPTAASRKLPEDGVIKLNKTTVLRVIGLKKDFKPTKIITQTYLFPRDIVTQSPDGLPPVGFPYDWGFNYVDYGMDQRVVNDQRYKEKIIDGLRSIPSYSLVMNLDDLFDEKNGIFANAKNDGREWERECSLELISAKEDIGFQENCGVRIRGGFSRMSANAKHAFRFFFRNEYGPGKLNYPVFGKDGAQEFDNIDLRTFSNYSWSLSDDPRCTFMRDQFNRDIQMSLGQSTARGYFCHLYINGQYWGLFNVCERPEASFGASYFKGKQEDFDVIKIGRGKGKGEGNTQYGLFATDGGLDAWQRFWKICKSGLESDEAYQKLLGNNPDGTRNPKYDVFLDVNNLIDYMLVIFYGGNLDAPITSFGANRSANNWYGIRNRNGDEGFRYYVWDAEHTFLKLDENRTGPYPAGDEYARSNPQWIWQQCLHNAEFRQAVADRLHKHFYNLGALAPESIAKLLNKRVNEIELAVICESARWGKPSPYSWAPPDRKSGDMRPRTLDDDWLPEVDRWFNEFIPKRSDIVLDQLAEHGLVPDLEPANLSKRGGVVSSGFKLKMSSLRGDIYYTLDGSDPRLVGGNISPVAQKYTKPIIFDKTYLLKVRVCFEDEWSAIDEVPFKVEGKNAVNNLK
ncbi:MAG: hypothetical protein CMO44_10095 [Verrucomicrobiales bacterium]|nr:hypothetical protein [Verrucomicrobiales bacterium]